MREPMKILVVSQYYWPEDFQVTAVCEGLAARGHDVTALVGLPDYPTGVIPEEYRHRRNRRQEKDGVRILRVGEIGRKRGMMGLALNYYSYALLAKSAARKLDGDYDVVFSYQVSPVTMVEPAIAYKKRTGAPLLLYCCDLWPESMKVLIGERMKPLFSYYEKVSRRIYREADILAAQSSAFPDYFEQVHGIASSQVRYIPHFASDKYLEEDFSRTTHDRVNFVFMGNIGRAQDIPCIIEAVARMRCEMDFAVHFVGDGSYLEEARRLADKKGVSKRIVFHGRKPFSDMPQYYRMADACLLTLDGSTWVGTTLPSKLQGYMAAGKPVLAAINGGARSVIEESGCGKAVDAGDSAALASLLDDFMVHPDRYSACGVKGRDYFKAHFSKEKHMDAIEGLLGELCGRKTDARFV